MQSLMMKQSLKCKVWWRNKV